MNSQDIPLLFSTIVQTIATLVSVYLAIFIFALNYFWRDIQRKRNTKNQRKKIGFWILFTMQFLTLIIYIFIFPIKGLHVINSFVAIFLFLFILISLYLFMKKKDYSYLEMGTILFSSIMAIFSIILGAYIMILGITGIPYYQFYNVDYSINLLNLFSSFVVILMLSAIYLISFILMHKSMISKN